MEGQDRPAELSGAAAAGGVERRRVWQCVGCGRIDDPRPCVGICRDEKIDVVLAADHDAALAHARAELEALRDVVRRIAATTPRTAECERTWLALQDRARRVLAEHPARD